MVNFGGFLGHSLSDWPGKSSCVVFLRGCNLRCPRCINQTLQNGTTEVDLNRIFDEINAVKNVSAVMISGGECLLQPDAIREIAEYAHDNQLLAGIETSGTLPENLERVLPYLDRVLMSVKDELKTSCYQRSTGTYMHYIGYNSISSKVAQSLDIIDTWDGEAEFATPVFNDNQDQLLHILLDLDRHTHQPRPWRLLRGVYPDKSEKPVTIGALQALASKLDHTLIGTRVRVIT